MESEEMTVILDGGGEVLVLSTRPLAVFLGDFIGP